MNISSGRVEVVGAVPPLGTYLDNTAVAIRNAIGTPQLPALLARHAGDYRKWKRTTDTDTVPDDLLDYVWEFVEVYEQAQQSLVGQNLDVDVMPAEAPRTSAVNAEESYDPEPEPEQHSDCMMIPPGPNCPQQGYLPPPVSKTPGQPTVGAPPKRNFLVPALIAGAGLVAFLTLKG